MAVVKDYMHGDCRIIVDDSFYASRTPEEAAQDRKMAHNVARENILARYARGEYQPLKNAK